MFKSEIIGENVQHIFMYALTYCLDNSLAVPSDGIPPVADYFNPSMDK